MEHAAYVAVNNFGDTRSGGLAGPMGLFVVILLAIVTVLLIRNMNKRLRRLPDRFPDPARDGRAAEVARFEAGQSRDEKPAGAAASATAASDVQDARPEAEVKDAGRPKGDAGRG